MTRLHYANMVVGWLDGLAVYNLEQSYFFEGIPKETRTEATIKDIKWETVASVVGGQRGRENPIVCKDAFVGHGDGGGERGAS